MHIVNLKPKILIGISDQMSLAEDSTVDLWRAFMPNRKFIKNTVGNDVMNLHIYPESVSFFSFTERTVFTKWACVEVSEVKDIPSGMDVLMLEGGTYLVEEHHGSSADIKNTYERIFRDIIPHANFSVDQRPHFEVLGENYLGQDPNSKEDIWIPIVFENQTY
jgi:AraC family transcriptional regulator